MPRMYTAQEMRELAECDDFEAYLYDDPKRCPDPDFAEDDITPMVKDMLRQAADMMDKLPSIIESRLGRAEKRQKHDIANELFNCLSWTVGDNPEACYADAQKLGKLWKRLRRESDEIESEWEEPKDAK